MKFKITTTNCSYQNPIDEILLKLGFKFEYDGNCYCVANDGRCIEKEINSLEELIELQKECKYKLILSNDNIIEIHDGRYYDD